MTWHGMKRAFHQIVDCLHKTAYRDKGDAETALILVKRRHPGNPPNTVYRCRCGAWHLGHAT